MKFKSIANPEPSLGLDFTGIPEVTVPDQAMGLQDILTRFTRGERLPVNMSPKFDGASEEDLDNPLRVDLEKMADSDFVDKALFSKELEDLKVKHEGYAASRKQKAAEAKSKADKEAEDKRIRILARKMAKENSKRSA